MKKQLTLITAVLFVLSFTSCEKSIVGPRTPKKDTTGWNIK